MGINRRLVESDTIVSVIKGLSVLPISQILEDCIHSAINVDTREFQWDVFFRKWFREHGSPYFFLFRKHLGVTNTQYAELFALLETYSSKNAAQAGNTHLLFHTTDHIRETLVETLNSVLDSKDEEKRVAGVKQFAERYVEVLSSTVAVDMFYCSSAIALPPGINLNLRQVCSDSGYIHSAGKSIYIRNIKKARIYDFRDSLDKHIEYSADHSLPIPFVVYAHEDFTGHDRDAKDQISKGIETTKLYLEKMSMGAYRLAEIVEQMRVEMTGKLDIPLAGPYEEFHLFSKDRALWLIGERSLSKTNPTNPGMERYYICYEQTVKSENPFFLFDENKPAWKSHTTLPHSLTGALLNITRPHPENVVICDPFGGTGTTWLEVKRLNLSARVETSDVSTIGPLMVGDNLEFFLSNSAELKELQAELENVRDAIRKEVKELEDGLQGSLDLEVSSPSVLPITPFWIVSNLVKQLRSEQPNEEQEYSYSKEFVENLGKEGFITRFLFYVALRAVFRYQGGYTRHSMVFHKAFLKSLEELISQIGQLVKIRSEIEKTVSSSQRNNYLTYQGMYSTEVVSAFFMKRKEDYVEEVKNSVATKDARNILPDSVDIILCDPPYGFNTTEDQGELAMLYSEFIDAAIKALKTQGHLIICLPAESYTGRDLPYCTRSGMITNQVLIKAHSVGRKAYTPALSLPTRSFSPPYYWEADKALRRTILHFRII